MSDARFDAKAGIDHDQTLGQQLREMLGLAIRPRKADARGLRDIVDAHEHEIEPPRADATRFEIEAQLVGELVDDALEILGIADRFGKAQFGARHFGRQQRRQRLHWHCRAPDRDAARLRRQSAFCKLPRGLLASCATRSMPTSLKDATVAGDKSQARDRQTGDRIRRAARRDNLRLAITRERPGAASRIGERRLGRDAFRLEALGRDHRSAPLRPETNAPSPPHR